jgi:hypothetical protein
MRHYSLRNAVRLLIQLILRQSKYSHYPLMVVLLVMVTALDMVQLAVMVIVPPAAKLGHGTGVTVVALAVTAWSRWRSRLACWAGDGC